MLGTKRDQDNALKALQEIPGIGKSLARDLVDLGFNQVNDLKDENPEKMYKDLIILRGEHIDPCVLYAFRCSVYYASNLTHEPHLLKWWNWKDIE